jgi:threonine dehydrogenase-like Zn-dependent dehydrogenase
MATHRAAVLSVPDHLSVEARPSVALASWQVRLRVDLAGVCGTDLALLHGHLPTPLPLVPGHEFVGTVVEIASSEDEHWLGQRVCADINNTCLSRREETPCRACRLGLSHHCQRRDVTGIITAPGAFAEEVIVPAANLFAVPDGVPDERAVFTEPLAAAIQAFEQVPVGEGDVVAVLGTGRLGSLIAAVAQRRGAATLASLGIGRPMCMTDENPRAVIDELTEGLGADVVVEVTGTPEGLAQALDLVRPRGTVILKTTCGLPAGGFDETRVVVDEVTLVGSRCGPFNKALALLADGGLPVEKLIAETHPLDSIARALERATQVLKVTVRPR